MKKKNTVYEEFEKEVEALPFTLTYLCDGYDKTCSLLAIGECSGHKVNGDYKLNLPSTITANDEEYTLTKIGTLNKSVSELYKDINITLNIPDSVTTICQHSLSFTKTIKKVTGMKNVTQIGEAAFSNSSLEEIIWPDKCEEVKNGVFLSCNLKKFSGGQSIKDIDRFAFNYCKADYVDLSDTSIISADINALFVRNGGSVSNIKLPSFMQWEMDEDIRTQLTSGYELDKDGTLKRKTSGAIGGIVGGIAGNEFVITGTLSMVRADFEREIISRGGFVSNRVSRSTTYLIVGAKPGATKLNAGKKYGIPQVTENDVRKAF